MAERSTVRQRSRPGSALENHHIHHQSQSRLPSTSSALPPSTSSATSRSSYKSSAASLSRVTRSSARQAANEAASANSTAVVAAAPSGEAAAPARLLPASPQPATKRKNQPEASQETKGPESSYSSRRTKRPRIQLLPESAAAQSSQPAPTVTAPVPAASLRRKKGKAPANMSSPESNAGHNPNDHGPSASSSRRPSRAKKNTQTMDTSSAASQPAKEQSTTSVSSSGRRYKRHNHNNQDQDVVMSGTEEHEKESAPPPPPPPEDHEDDSDVHEDDDHRYDEVEDPFGGFGGHGPHDVFNPIAHITSMMSGISGKLRRILGQLQQKDDPTIQQLALQELSEILLVSNEDNLSGNFSPDVFVKELVALMQPNEITGEESPEIMLLACRNLANLMEALPQSTANVVYGGAVPVLCQKLLEISFIDLAEQALSTLEKISVEFPTSIVREGGLTACLSYLEFFATSTQRVAVTTAANCCRNIPEDSFNVIRDVMPILLNVLGSSDQRVVEQASLCVSRIVESFKYHMQKLEELVSVDLLKVVLRLLLPGSTNLIGPHIHTQFLRVLAFTARASPRLAAELFKMNVVETVYQILTGVSPPSGTEDVASKLDSVLIMQALIHRPREQIIETLNVVCELLPGLPSSANPVTGDLMDIHGGADSVVPPSSRKRSSSEKRVELLEDCREQVRRFALILFPTLTDAYSSTVNLSVRQKVLSAQIKMLSNLDAVILEEALKYVPYASFLASILSQKDHPSLIILALQATELLMSRLDTIYRYQLYREGVITEITRLAEEPEPAAKEGDVKPNPLADPDADDDDSDDDDSDPDEDDEDAGEDDENEDGNGENEDNPSRHSPDEDDDENAYEHDHHPDMSGSPASSEGSTLSIDAPEKVSGSNPLPSRISEVAKKFLEVHETEKQGKNMKRKAAKILANLSSLAAEIERFFSHDTPRNVALSGGRELFARLASYFDSDVLESVTSAELLSSGVVRVLEQIFSNLDAELAVAAQSAFLQVFMGYSVKSKPKTATADSPATHLSVMIHKLQDLLSRSENFEVITVNHNSFDGNRSGSASMLAKQIRLRLMADENSDIPRAYRNIQVSIHAITTFKSLDDYLRPRLTISERPRPGRRGDLSARTLAAIVGATGMSMSEAAASLASRGPLPSLGSLVAPGGARPPPPVASGTASGSASRSSRKVKAKSQPVPEVPLKPETSTSKDKTTLRRSARRQHMSDAAALPRPPTETEDNLENALECADERQLTDEDDDLGEASALSVVRDLDDSIDDALPPDPSAVNLEVAAGGKITARKEDGTRVPTPAQNQVQRSAASLLSRASALAAAMQAASPSSSRPMSYSAAIQSVPQDWHIEFSVNAKVIPHETTVYRAVHSSSISSEDHFSRGLWSAIHSIKFRRVPGPPPAESIPFSPFPDNNAEGGEASSPGSLAKHPTTASILRLLKKLHDLNANIDDVIVENKQMPKLNAEPLSQFVNTKLTAKLNRQLEEPLIVASNCLPSWSEDLARLYPFLFPFETRHLFLQSTSFGYARSMNRWQNTQSQEDSRRDRRDDRLYLGRLQRQKVRISRSKILESAIKVMELYGSTQSILEVEYFEEVGTGLGPTLEFYSTVSKEFSKKKLKLWRDNDPGADEDFVSGPTGLFPRPVSEEFADSEEGKKLLNMFKMLGRFVARSMIDSRIIDLNFNPIFFRIGYDPAGVRPSLGAVKVVDPVVARSLMTIKKFALAKKEIDEDPKRSPTQKVADTENIVVDKIRIDDLYLDFTLPGYADIELIPNGSQIRLSIDNVDIYLEKVIDRILGSGVKQQVAAFRQGFSLVFPYTALSAFTPAELCTLFGRVEEDWSLETLTDSIKADHGYNMDSKSVKNLLQTMSELCPARRRDFLQFTTGSPKLPIGGFKSLTPMFTVVCKPSEAPYTSDDYLPSVMTCVNYLKLPDYTDIDIMRKRLHTAIKEGQGAFHLS